MKKALTYSDVLLIPQYSEIKSRANVSTQITSKCGKVTAELPVFSANMDSISSVDMMQYINRKGGIGSLHRFMTVEENVEQYLQSPENTFCSLGLNDQKRFEELYMAGCRRYMLDLAHGHSSMMSDALKWLKNKANDIVIVAGNVCTADGAAFLVDQGADIVKVGVGPGSVCTTRDKTGHGYPQLSAVMECSSAIPNNSVIADGGLKHPGDIVKALAAGADFVMLGSMFAGSYYTPGRVSTVNFLAYKTYRGMASEDVYEEYSKAGNYKCPEGVSVTVPYKCEAETEKIVLNIVGGLRSGLTYSGAKNIKDLQAKAKFVEASSGTKIENGTLK